MVSPQEINEFVPSENEDFVDQEVLNDVPVDLPRFDDELIINRVRS